MNLGQYTCNTRHVIKHVTLKFSLQYYCENYCMEILHFLIKIEITLHQRDLLK